MKRTVVIPAKDEHEGIFITQVTLEWICPECGGPRGEPQIVRSYDGSRSMTCQGWTNPCGHVDKYSAVRQEAKHWQSVRLASLLARQDRIRYFEQHGQWQFVVQLADNRCWRCDAEATAAYCPQCGAEQDAGGEGR